MVLTRDVGLKVTVIDYLTIVVSRRVSVYNPDDSLKYGYFREAALTAIIMSLLYIGYVQCIRLFIILGKAACKGVF